MVRRLIEQRKAIDDYLIENKMIDLFLSDKEWKLLEALVNLLTPFEEVSKLFCASPLSVVIPYAKQMERFNFLHIFIYIYELGICVQSI